MIITYYLISGLISVGALATNDEDAENSDFVKAFLFGFFLFPIFMGRILANLNNYLENDRDRSN